MLAGLNDRLKVVVFASTGSADTATWAAADQASIKAQGVSAKASAVQSSIFDPDLYYRRNTTAAFHFMWGKDEPAPDEKAWHLANAPKHATPRLHAAGHGALADAQEILLAWIQKNL